MRVVYALFVGEDDPPRCQAFGGLDVRGIDRDLGRRRSTITAGFGIGVAIGIDVGLGVGPLVSVGAGIGHCRSASTAGICSSVSIRSAAPPPVLT
ncbi:hypothetical protein BRC68_13975 [Halobacteriales archaeon QH_6_64_20]|nr:MAG: hypothetical protein BRC68_13975 [Halobacteriales archaeon QH_6_64_20]